LKVTCKPSKPKFNIRLCTSMLDAPQGQPVCANLPLSGYLLETVQRIPRYKLLLQGEFLKEGHCCLSLITDYLKHLPEDSDDREQSESKSFISDCMCMFY